MSKNWTHHPRLGGISVVVHLISRPLNLVRYSNVYITVLYSVCNNLILDVGLHGFLYENEHFLLDDQRSHSVLYVRLHKKIWILHVFICLNDPRWSTAHEFPSHGYKCCKVLCFFHRKSSVLFSPKLLNSECVLPSSIAVTSSTVLVFALQSYVTEHKTLRSLPFIQRQNNEVQIGCSLVLLSFL